MPVAPGFSRGPGPVKPDVSLREKTERVRTDEGRKRKSVVGNVSQLPRSFNPYPWMSLPEALIHLELEHRTINFSWRFFPNLPAVVPLTAMLIPDFAPEFTLPMHKLVILVVGNYFGTLPGILDRNALAQALLEEDGWKAGFLYENDILRSPSDALEKEFPQLRGNTLHGPVIPNPYGAIDLLRKQRNFLKGRGTRKQKATGLFNQEIRDESDRRYPVRSANGSEYNNRIRSTYRAFQTKRGHFRSR